MFRAFVIVCGFLLLAGVVAGAGWFVVRTVKRAEDPARMAVKWIVTLPIAVLCLLSVHYLGPLGPFLIVACAVVLSIIWTPHIAAGMVSPITNIFDGGNLEPEPRPAYSTAQARQKQGRYLEAVAEVRKQLQRFPTDFEGQMFLAKVLAEDLKDLPAAEGIIEELCAQPGHAPRNIAYALNTLADWHLKLLGDREAARRVLQGIVDLLPDSEFSLAAAQRIAHLDHPERAEAKSYQVTQGPRNLGLTGAIVNAPQVDPAELAQAYVRHLEHHPLDTEVREKLAVIYADHYARLDLAAAELEQMITQPHQPPRLAIRWLNVLADCQIRCGADYETVKSTLQRIIDLQPNFATAETARKRIDLLKLELKAKQTSPAVKLGSYEQNIGLKQGLPHQF